MNSAVLCAHGNVFKYLSLLDLERQRNKQDAIDVRMVHIHPTSSLSVEGTECPHTYVLYQALVHSSKLYMKQIARADSRLLKTLQREWEYVDPYVLCGRQHERPVSTNNNSSESSDKRGSDGRSGSSGSSKEKSNDLSSSVAVAASTGAQQVESTKSLVASTERNIGMKRPLSPSVGSGHTVTSAAVASSAMPVPVSTGAVAGPSAAAEAAKQRYLERMAQQKARK